MKYKYKYKVLIAGEIQPTLYPTYESAQAARVKLGGNMLVKIAPPGVKEVCNLPGFHFTGGGQGGGVVH